MMKRIISNLLVVSLLISGLVLTKTPVYASDGSSNGNDVEFVSIKTEKFSENLLEKRAVVNNLNMMGLDVTINKEGDICLSNATLENINDANEVLSQNIAATQSSWVHMRQYTIYNIKTYESSVKNSVCYGFNSIIDRKNA